MDKYLKEDETFEAYDKKFVVVEVLVKNEKHYILTDELKDNNIPLSKFEIFENVDGGIRKVIDDNIKGQLLKEFSDKLNSDLLILNEKIKRGNLNE